MSTDRRRVNKCTTPRTPCITDRGLLPSEDKPVAMGQVLCDSTWRRDPEESNSEWRAPGAEGGVGCVFIGDESQLGVMNQFRRGWLCEGLGPLDRVAEDSLFCGVLRV